MIEGLKVTLTTQELRSLCLQKADYHGERAAVYLAQLRNLEQAEVLGMDYTNGDPRRAMGEKRNEHEDKQKELHFIAEHLKPDEEYLLDEDALRHLGILSGRSRW